VLAPDDADDSNTVHRHEPPVTNDPVVLLHIDKAREFCVISKPGSMPVHAAGRYFKHTMLEVLMEEHGIKGYAVNRLDRLTSGLMILALSGPASRDLAQEFLEGKVGKEYVARVRGKFPEEEITVDKPLLTVDRQMGLVIIAPEGKEAKTVFKRMSYDAERDQSVVHCRPLTGRTHQIRVHLQYLGHPIANDPIYASEAAFGPGCGQGGVDLVEQGEQNTHLAALAERVQAAKLSGGKTGLPPPVPSDEDRLAGKEQGPEHAALVKTNRVTDNVDLTSPIRLSTQARNIIATLRRQRDEAEDWVKWKEVVYATKAAQEALETSSADASGMSTPVDKPRRKIPHPRINKGMRGQKAADRPEVPTEAIRHMPRPAHIPKGFCEECFVPVPDDPDPTTLFIYLHALRYTTERLGTWSTPLPRWAGEEWDGDWRGWAGEPPVTTVPKEALGDAAEAEGAVEEEGVRAVG
jgi:RluA family pseudouridine synthase